MQLFHAVSEQLWMRCSLIRPFSVVKVEPCQQHSVECEVEVLWSNDSPPPLIIINHENASLSVSQEREREEAENIAEGQTRDFVYRNWTGTLDWSGANAFAWKNCAIATRPPSK
ncbi:Acetyl-coenzyme A synthetase [Trichinella spiralis]|uniref:Acetyl-coenzyme A synthetase n=1 Tax=Trichinella spiralis TaxID=6334 RepID=A0ABR3KJS6_TRISP